MIARLLTMTAVVLTAQLVIACNTPSTDTDARVADLEKRLAETEKQLADARQAQSPHPAQPVEPAAPPAPTATAGSKPAVSAKPLAVPPATKLARPTEPPLSQKYMTAAQAEREKAELQRIVDEQRAVNKAQSESNLKLQEQVDRLKPREFTLVEGTVIPVRTTAELSTAKLANGSTFEGLLETDLKAGETVLAKAGSRVTCVVVSSDLGGRVKGTASLAVSARSVIGARGQVIPLKTNSFRTDAESTKKRDAARTGIATGVGAIIGGIAGGGSGAAKGAGAGAAAGVGVDLATRGEPATIPAETLIEFRLTSPATVTLQP
jgi:hypothetical protein